MPQPSVILRNLTKREYTREDASQCGSLDHQLIARCCWSTYIGSIVLDPEPESLYHGPWAGDRFDVVLMKDLECVLGNDGKVVRVPKEEWKDVTDEIMELIDRLVAAEYELLFRLLQPRRLRRSADERIWHCAVHYMNSHF